MEELVLSPNEFVLGPEELCSASEKGPVRIFVFEVGFLLLFWFGALEARRSLSESLCLGQKLKGGMAVPAV
ncbi:MAG: hypothetical protein EBY32_03615 [Proteobacteria bacterium]|nr:hypothetical protein [Pseudomonadota bacterium]